MTDQQDTTPDLRALESKYAIIGELRGADGVRRYVARRHDGGEVLITVAEASNTGDNNGLAHLASDTQLLSVAHPGVSRVIDGQWLGADRYAVVTERVHGNTLAEVVSRGDRVSKARIALLLQEVDGVLDWARHQGVVHRGVTPESVFFEPGTDRVVVSFAPTRLPITGVPDARGDAKTIGALAWLMIGGQRYAEGGEGEQQSLAQLCPELAGRVVDAVERMVHAEASDAPPDIPALLAVISAGDALKEAEVEVAAMREEFTEQRRALLEQFDTERVQIQAAAVEQRNLLAKERADLARVTKRRQQQLAAIRSELDKQRVEIERRLADLEARRLEVEHLRSQVGSSAKLRPTPIRDRTALHPERWGWEIPVGIATVVLLLLAGLVSVSRRDRPTVSPQAMNAGAVTANPTTPATGRGARRAATDTVPSQSAAGTLERRITNPRPPKLETPIRRDSATMLDSLEQARRKTTPP